ncbi:MAG: hypothetical protein ACPGR7_04310 [Flavobacteriaceae bacterium]
MNKLESFINQNREGFDRELPSLNHEDRFRQKLALQNPPRKRNTKIWIGIAASIALIFSFILGTKFQSQPVRGLASVSPEMEQTQFYYTSKIQTEIKKVKSFETPSNQDLVASSFAQLYKLEHDYQKLENNLQIAPGNKQLIAAMIKNYQLRVRVLNELLNRLEPENYENLKI